MMRRTELGRGFTLIELLLVIAMIGLLSSVVLASLNSARIKARDARRLADAKQIQTALELAYDRLGKYPSGSDSASGAAPSCWWCNSIDGESTWIGGIAGTDIPTVPRDPVNSWTKEQVYYYTADAAGADYCLQISQEGDCSSNPNYRGVWSGTCKLRLGPSGPTGGLCWAR